MSEGEGTRVDVSPPALHATRLMRPIPAADTVAAHMGGRREKVKLCSVSILGSHRAQVEQLPSHLYPLCLQALARYRLAMQITLDLNGDRQAVDVSPATLLVDLLRDRLHLTGTHIGCDTSQCGACNVLVDGVAMKSCTLLAVQLDGCAIATIEGVANGAALHAMQEAFKTHHGLQCGFCTPGMVMAGLEIVRRHGHDLSRETIAHGLEGNLCRCTGYQNIISAIQAGAKAMQDA